MKQKLCEKNIEKSKKMTNPNFWLCYIFAKHFDVELVEFNFVSIFSFFFFFAIFFFRQVWVSLLHVPTCIAILSSTSSQTILFAHIDVVFAFTVVMWSHT